MNIWGLSQEHEGFWYLKIYVFHHINKKEKPCLVSYLSLWGQVFVSLVFGIKNDAERMVLDSC